MLGAGFCANIQSMNNFIMDSDGYYDLLNVHQKCNDIPLFKDLLNKYNSLSHQELSELRHYWKSPHWSSELRDEKNIKLIIDYAQKLRKNYQDYDLICALGQSRSYEVLTAQILANLCNEDTNRYLLIAFSGGFKRDCYMPNKTQIEHYRKYLQDIGFTHPKNKKIVLCELVERCDGLASFIKILCKYQKQGIYDIPEIKFNIHLYEYIYFLKNIRTNIVQNANVRIFAESQKYKPKSIFKSFPDVCFELTASRNSARLVKPYKPEIWLTTNPLKFTPRKSALNRMLCIIDYIHQHLDEYKLDSSTLKSKL